VSFAYTELALSREWAAPAALMVALHPFLWIYAATVNSELLYILCFLAGIYFYARHRSETSPRNVWTCLILAYLCAVASMFFRPEGRVLVVAMALHMLLYNRKPSQKKLAALACLFAIYGLFALGTHALVRQITGYEPAKQPYGENLYVGASDTGSWNEADGAEFQRVYDQAKTPSEVHAYFFPRALERYREMGMGIPAHFLKKMNVWISDEYLLHLAMSQSGSSRFFPSKAQGDFQRVIFVYDYAFMFFGLLGCIYLVLAGLQKRQPLDLAVFFLAGSILLLMVTEVAPRYTLPYRPLLVLFSVQLFAFTKRKWYNSRVGAKAA
jgi:cell division protein FtsW (lipid II flippase)